MEYRNYIIQKSDYPYGNHQYEYFHNDWDLDDIRCGSGETIEECKEEIDDLED